MRTLFFVLPLAAAALLATGCVAGDDAGERAGQAVEAQVPWYKVWRSVELTFADRARTPLAVMVVVSRQMGDYQPRTEYWYVNRAALGELGTAALEITTTDFDRGAPSDPGYASEQAFTQIEFPTSGWSSPWTTDPLGGGALYQGGGGISLRITTSTTGQVSRVAWYQVIPATASPQWITPSGSFAVGGASVTVPAGYAGYDIEQPAE